MNPIRYAGVVAFIDWLARTHPEVRSIRELDRDKFLTLATQYESSKGLRIDENHEVYWKWQATQGFFQRSASDRQALNELERIH